MHVMFNIAGPAKQCPLGLQYRECISCCPESCSLERTCIDSKLACLDGCYCPDGWLLFRRPANNHLYSLRRIPHLFNLWTCHNEAVLRPPGLIYEDGGCVTTSDCPCEYHGMFYPSGQTLQEECNNWWALTNVTVHNNLISLADVGP